MGAVCNGVDVDRLTGLIENIKKDPGEASLTFRVVSEWKGGFRSQHVTSAYRVGYQTKDHARNHSVMTDEPEAILGCDSGISPAETILASLASCPSVGYAANAAAMGIDIEELSFEITGRGDHAECASPAADCRVKTGVTRGLP